MPATISLTESQSMIALRTVLLEIVPTGLEVIRGQANRVPEPLGPDFVVFTPIMRRRLSTNVEGYDDEPLASPPIGKRNTLAPMQLTVQLDVHGPNGSEHAHNIATLLRGEWACTEFERTGYDVQPLYTEEPRQVAFENGEQQTEDRWIVDVHLQANPIVGTPQDFAAEAKFTFLVADRAVAGSGSGDVAIYDQSEYDDGSVYAP